MTFGILVYIAFCSFKTWCKTSLKMAL